MWVYRGGGGRYEYIICKINSHQKHSFCLERTYRQSYLLGPEKPAPRGVEGADPPTEKKNRTLGAPYVGTPLVKKIVEEAEDEELQTVTDFR